MGLPDLVDGIVADFATDTIPVPCQVLYGPDHIAEHGAPLRIVVVPTDDTYGPPQTIQGASWPSGDMADGQNPRPVMTRNEGARATIWAAAAKQSNPANQQRADYDMLHQLINRFCLALHRVNPGNYQIQRGSTTETTRVVRLGYVYTLSFSIQVPIVDIEWSDTTTWDTETGVSQDTTVETVKSDDTVIKAVEF